MQPHVEIPVRCGLVPRPQQACKLAGQRDLAFLSRASDPALFPEARGLRWTVARLLGLPFGMKADLVRGREVIIGDLIRRVIGSRDRVAQQRLRPHLVQIDHGLLSRGMLFALRPRFRNRPHRVRHRGLLR